VQLSTTVQLGDLLLAGTVVASTVGAYFALKSRLDVMEGLVSQLVERLDRIDAEVRDHAKQLATLEAAVHVARPSGRSRPAS
jgi:hypothetical protein